MKVGVVGMKLEVVGMKVEVLVISSAHLYVHLNELVEGVELLPDQPLLLEVRGDHDPARLGKRGEGCFRREQM